MGRIEKAVFISYRRANLPWALAIYQNLTHHGYDVFFDYQSINSGDFEQIILGNIRARAHFLVLLAPSALEGCNNPDDWLRREIETGIDQKRNVVPLFLEGFDFANPKISKSVTGKIAQLKNYNGLNIPADYFDEAMGRLRQRYLNISLETILHPVPSLVQKAVIEQQNAANHADEVQPPANFKIAVLNHDFSYVFFYGRNGAWWNRIPKALKDKLAESQTEAHEFKSVTLGPDSSWVFLYDYNAYWWSGISEELVDKMQEAYSKGLEFHSVALGPDSSWVFLYDYNAYRWNGIPQDLAQEIEEANSKGLEFKSVTLGPNSSWVFLYDYNAYRWSGIPQDLAEYMQEANSQGYEFKSVTLGANSSWIFLYGHNGYSYNNIPRSLLKKMRKVYRS